MNAWGSSGLGWYTKFTTTIIVIVTGFSSQQLYSIFETTNSLIYKPNTMEIELLVRIRGTLRPVIVPFVDNDTGYIKYNLMQNGHSLIVSSILRIHNRGTIEEIPVIKCCATAHYSLGELT